MANQNLTPFDAVNTPISRPMLLEASAGTGKTYSLMHLILRLLVEERLELNSILVVTFTKSATYELSSRLRQNLTELKENLISMGEDPESFKGDPLVKAQLKAWIAKGISLEEVKQITDQALSQIDDAAIFTIHSFCQRILQDFVFSSKGNYDFQHGDDTDAKSQAVEHFLRSELPKTFPDEPKVQRALASEDIWTMFLGKLSGLSRGRPLKDQVRLQLDPMIEEEKDPRIPILFDLFVQEAVEEYRQNKQKERIFTFDDLLIEAEERVIKEPQFVEEVRKQFKAALIDEFQDTDPVQYSVFEKLFLADSATRPVIFVGDPKQSIYAFRNAELDTYLEAKNVINNSLALTKNFRSTPGIMVAVNEIFELANKLNQEDPEANAFFNPKMPYAPVEFNAQKLPLFYKNDDGKFEPIPSFALWSNLEGSDTVFGLDGKESNASAEDLRKAEAVLIAEDIRRLLSGKYYYNGKELQAGDIAILVLKRDQASLIREELEKRNIRYLLPSDANVLESAEAEEIKGLLRAIIDPKDVNAVSSAQATKLFGYTLRQVLEDEGAASAARLLLEKAGKVFEKEGILAAFSQLFSGSQTEKRMLENSGERALTNYQHILEILYEKRNEISTLPGLLRWLENKDWQKEDSEEFKLRRETDRDVVRIETVHASKGLQYPVVYYPDRSSQIRGTQIYKDPKSGKWVFSLHEVKVDGADATEEQQLVAHKELEESIRKLYVALTRATARLVVPYFCKKTTKGVHKKTGGCYPLVQALVGKEDPSARVSEALHTLANLLPTQGASPLAGLDLVTRKADEAAKNTSKKKKSPALTLPELDFKSVQAVTDALKCCLAERKAKNEDFPFPLASGELEGYSPFDICLNVDTGKVLSLTPVPLAAREKTILEGCTAAPQTPDWKKSSFSGLMRNIDEETSSVITDEVTEDEEELATPAAQNSAEEDFLETLRGSQSAAEFGTDIHSLMEAIFGPDTSSWQMKVSRFIDKRTSSGLLKLEGSSPEEQAQARQVWVDKAQAYFKGVLTAPIIPPPEDPEEGQFCLERILTEGMEGMPEMEFLLSVGIPKHGKNSANPGNKVPLTAELLIKTLAAFDDNFKDMRLSRGELNGYLTGSIDLAFGGGGRYWILDWKTNKVNYRNNRPSDYTAAAVEELMRHNHYHLQLTLYLVALKRLLEQRLELSSGDGVYELLGGGIYYFLRGSDGKERGIYRYLPSQAMLETLDDFLKHGYSETVLQERSRKKRRYGRQKR